MTMDQLPEIWHWTKQVAGIVFATLLVLYVIRCVSDVHIVTLIQFELFINKLMKVIFC